MEVCAAYFMFDIHPDIYVGKSHCLQIQHGEMDRISLYADSWILARMWLQDLGYIGYPYILLQHSSWTFKVWRVL